MKKPTIVYRVTFLQEDTVYQLYTRHLTDDTMVGFVEVEDLIFNKPTSSETGAVEQELRTEFAGVKRIYLPQHLVLRIDEVEEASIVAPTTPEGNNVSHFPTKTKRPSEGEQV